MLEPQIKTLDLFSLTCSSIFYAHIYVSIYTQIDTIRMVCAVMRLICELEFLIWDLISEADD